MTFSLLMADDCLMPHLIFPKCMNELSGLQDAHMFIQTQRSASSPCAPPLGALTLLGPAKLQESTGRILLQPFAMSLLLPLNSDILESSAVCLLHSINVEMHLIQTWTLPLRCGIPPQQTYVVNRKLGHKSSHRSDEKEHNHPRNRCCCSPALRS